MIGVIGAWSNLRALVVLLAKIPIGLARGICGIITCSDPVSIQLATGVDRLGYEVGYRLSRDPERYPRLFTASTVPLTTWLWRPAAGMDSYRRHLRAWREYEEEPQPEGPIDTLHDWSTRYGMVNPDDLDLVRGGRRSSS